jgi:hypothetical protein
VLWRSRAPAVRAPSWCHGRSGDGFWFFIKEADVEGPVHPGSPSAIRTAITIAYVLWGYLSGHARCVEFELELELIQTRMM